MSPHLDDLITRIPALKSCASEIAGAFDLFHASYLAGGKLLLCGNGGSAADAEHWAGELLKGFMLPRKLSAAKNSSLPEDLLNRLQWALPAIPLTGFPSFATAFANDVDPDFVFAQLTWALGKPGDVLVCMSTSGNSKNVCHAARAAKARKMSVVALTGESGGRLKNLADVCIAAPAARTPLVQEYHLPIYHCLCLMLEDAWTEING